MIADIVISVTKIELADKALNYQKNFTRMFELFEHGLINALLFKYIQLPTDEFSEILRRKK